MNHATYATYLVPRSDDARERLAFSDVVDDDVCFLCLLELEDDDNNFLDDKRFFFFLRFGALTRAACDDVDASTSLSPSPLEELLSSTRARLPDNWLLEVLVFVAAFSALESLL